jgi:hypothetical protein
MDIELCIRTILIRHHEVRHDGLRRLSDGIRQGSYCDRAARRSSPGTRHGMNKVGAGGSNELASYIASSICKSEPVRL